jgi:hypothetical protein
VRAFFQRDAHVANRLPAFAWILAQAALDDEPRRLRQRAQVRFLAQHLDENIGNGFSAEQRLAHDDFVQHRAEGPNIGALVDHFAAGLLRAHVRGRAHDHSGASRRNAHRGGIAGIHFLLLAVFHRGEAKIENFYDVVGSNQDIGRLQIAVHDSFLVRGFERGGDLLRVIQCGLKRQRTFDRRAGNQLHHQRAHAGRGAGLRFFNAVNLRDVGMIQRSQHFGFALETRQPLRIARQRVRQNLDRHRAIQFHIARAIHFAHAPGAERRLDLVRP